jgi:hypothetical protein
MKEVDNVLRIFEETKEAIDKGDSAKINTLSNQTMNTASLTQDPDNIAVAVIVYSLSKIIERQNYKELRGWKPFYTTYLNSINNILDALKNNKEKQLKQNLELIRQSIEKLSGKLKIYIQDVFRKAKINKASKIHEHGLSSEKTASLLGITMHELASYAGQKNLADIPETLTIDIKTRINTAMEMFE